MSQFNEYIIKKVFDKEPDESAANVRSSLFSSVMKDVSGQQVKTMRSDVLNMSRREFCDITKLAQTTLTNLETGRALLTHTNLMDANMNFNDYIIRNNLNIKQNAFALVALCTMQPEDIFIEQEEKQGTSLGIDFGTTYTPHLMVDISGSMGSSASVRPPLNYEKEKVYDLYKQLSEIDQAKITERMEYIISTYESEDNIPTKRIAVLGQTACGNPIEAIEIADEFIETNELKATFALRAVGDSMSPLINDGDVILIKQTEELEVSDIGIFQINETGFSDDEEVTCKMLKSIKDGVMTLVPLNPSHDPIVVDSKKHQVKIIGKYIGRA